MLSSLKTSFFKDGIGQTTGAALFAVSDVLEGIKDGKWKEPIEKYRAMPAGPAKSEAKRKLPYWTPSGTFEKREASGLLEHTGLICMDFDKLGDAAAAVRDKVADDPIVSFCALSAGREGIYCIVKIDGDPGLHGAAFSFLQDYFLQFHGLTADKSCKDVSRARFVSYDPDAVLNDGREVLASKYIKDYLTAKEADARAARPANNGQPRGADKGDGHPYIARCIENKKAQAFGFISDATDGHKHQARLHASILLGGLVPHHLSRENAKDVLMEALANAGSLNDGALKTVEDGLGFGEKRPIYFTVPDNHGAKAQTDGDGDQDILFDAETPKEYIAPFIPARVYEILPEPLRRLTASYAGRDKDICLLALLVCISGIGLGTADGEKDGDFALYDGKVIYPNLFAFIAGPSGNGKGSAATATGILKTISENMDLKNARAMDTWKADNTKESVKANGGNYTDKPIQSILEISGDCTASKLNNLLAENPSGIILFETEADTIAEKFKGEHGNYSSLLRKAAEHETLISTRVTSGVHKCKTPRLAVFVSGTHSQIPRMFKNTEDGLFGRFLFYNYSEIQEMRNVDAVQENIKAKFESFAGFFAGLRAAESMQLVFSHAQSEVFFTASKAQRDKYFKLNGGAAIGIINRLGNRHRRIALILERLRIGDKHTGKIVCSEESFEAATLITDTLIQHTFLTLDSFAGTEIRAEKTVSENLRARALETENQNKFYESLPANFTTGDANMIGAGLGLNTKAVQRFIGKPIFKKISHGQYRKN